MARAFRHDHNELQTRQQFTPVIITLDLRQHNNGLQTLQQWTSDMKTLDHDMKTLDFRHENNILQT